MLPSSLFDLKWPKKKVSYTLGSFDIDPNVGHLSATLRNQPYNRKIEIFVPTEGQIDVEIFRELKAEPQSFYYLRECELSKLLEPVFVDRHIRNGQLYALSANRRLGTDDVVAIHPNGELLLSVQRDTYTKLGLCDDNRYTQHRKKTTSLTERNLMPHLISIDLKKKNFVPGKKNYDRVLWCLTDRFPKVDLVVSIGSNPDGSASEHKSSIQFPDSVENVRLGTKSEFNTWKLQVPFMDIDLVLSKKDGSTEVDVEYLEYMTEWIGAVNARIRSYFKKIEDEMTNCFKNDKLETQFMIGHIVTHEGFIPSDICFEKIKALNKLIQENHAAWGVITVWGFENSPLNRPSLDFYDYFYIVFLMPGNHYVIINPAL